VVAVAAAAATPISVAVVVAAVVAAATAVASEALRPPATAVEALAALPRAAMVVAAVAMVEATAAAAATATLAVPAASRGGKHRYTGLWTLSSWSLLPAFAGFILGRHFFPFDALHHRKPFDVHHTRILASHSVFNGGGHDLFDPAGSAGIRL
jgi:hypothetical protein